MGARVKVRDFERTRWNRISANTTVAIDVAIDVRRDKEGEYFDLRVNEENKKIQIIPVDVQPKDRHLLLLVKDGNVKSKFLCGHDERHWFVAAIPESEPVTNVKSAKIALKPEEVRALVIPSKHANKRKNSGFVRQGEWFFVPVKAKISLNWTDRILKNEPMVRSDGGKPHYAEELIRYGGEDVWVCRHYPSGLTEENYQKEIFANQDAKRWNWSRMRRNPEVYVRGKISHADHATITLDGWHRVHMNTEPRARARANVVFLD
jgi:hypothetical protein